MLSKFYLHNIFYSYPILNDVITHVRIWIFKFKRTTTTTHCLNSSQSKESKQQQKNRIIFNYVSLTQIFQLRASLKNVWHYTHMLLTNVWKLRYLRVRRPLDLGAASPQFRRRRNVPFKNKTNFPYGQSQNCA